MVGGEGRGEGGQTAMRWVMFRMLQSRQALRGPPMEVRMLMAFMNLGVVRGGKVCRMTWYEPWHVVYQSHGVEPVTQGLDYALCYLGALALDEPHGFPERQIAHDIVTVVIHALEQRHRLSIGFA